MDEIINMKIIVVGNSATGKTSISNRYVNQKFYENQQSTVTTQLLIKKIIHANRTFKVSIWDTAGQQRYRATTKNHYRGAAGVVLVYNITDAQSYLDVQVWMRAIYQVLDVEDTSIILVGNKIDLASERVVQKNRPIRQYQYKFDIKCWQVSAKTGQNINQMFSYFALKIYKSFIRTSKISEISDISSVIYQSQINIQNYAQNKNQNKTETKPNRQNNTKNQTEKIRRSQSSQIKQKNIKISHKTSKKQKLKNQCC